MTRRSFRVDWTVVAQRDLFGIVDYLAARNPPAAAAALERLERHASALARNPGRGRVVPELERLHVREYRELIVDNYRLLYRVTGSRVLVLGLLDSRRALADLVFDRLTREA